MLSSSPPTPPPPTPPPPLFFLLLLPLMLPSLLPVVPLLLQLFDRWCTDDKNSVLIPGYSVEGTLAKKLLSMPDEVQGMDGRVSEATPGISEKKHRLARERGVRCVLP